MYKWSLLLLASAAVFQPIASFTERNLVDGRQQCCDHQPQLLRRDTRLAVYGNYRLNKVASEDRRLNLQRDVPSTRQYEVRRAETAPSRETESPNFRRFIAGRSTRLSRFDRRAADIESREQKNRHVSGDRSNWVSVQRERNYRDSQIRISRDTARVASDQQRSRLSMDSRRQQRLLTRETTNMRDNRAFSEGRDALQRTRNDVVQANIRNNRISREAKFLNRHNNMAFSDSRRQNVNDNNREYRSLEQRVRDVSEARLPLARSRMVDQNRRIIRDNRMREVNLNHRVARESHNERVRQAFESSRVTDSRRALNERDQIREDFRQERRVALADQRFANTAEREVRMRTRPESTEQSEERQLRKIRENVREYDARDAQRSAIEINRRFVRSVDRSFPRDTKAERRQMTRSLDRRSNMPFASSESRRSLLSRDESRNTNRQNTRYNARDTRETERRSVDRQTRIDRLVTPTNTELRRSSENRIMSRRISRDADFQSRNVERRTDSVTENNRSFKDESTRANARSNSRNHERLPENRRTSERRMERNRYEARSVENVRAERQDKRFDNRADMSNQRSARANNFNERSQVLTRKSRKLERDASHTRDARINNENRETRNGENRNTRTAADARDRSETRSRLTLAEAARFRREYLSKNSMEQESLTMNWQYLFYTLQGIYLCGIIATMLKEKPDSHKSRSWWVLSTKAVKVD